MQSAAGFSHRSDFLRTARTALVVDDNSTLRYVLARLARLAGFEILEANDGASALELALKKLPNVIVADVRLPGFDGFELCRRVKADSSAKKIPIILVTSMYYESAVDSRALAAGKSKAQGLGAVDLLPRGEAVEKLAELLRRVVGGRGPAKKKTAAKRPLAKKPAKNKV